MKWRTVEKTLLEALHSALTRFVTDHRNERFYGVALDVNADYGEVFLSLNTEAGLASCAAKRYPQYSSEEIEGHLRWSVGDWQYHGLNTDPPYLEAWEEAWSRTQEQIHDAYLDDEHDEVSEQFLESVCRVLLRLERSPAFMQLAREPGFKTLVIDHDELLEDGWERLARIRADRA